MIALLAVRGDVGWAILFEDGVALVGDRAGGGARALRPHATSQDISTASATRRSAGLVQLTPLQKV